MLVMKREAEVHNSFLSFIWSSCVGYGEEMPAWSLLVLSKPEAALWLQVLEIYDHTSHWRAENRTGREHKLLRTLPWRVVFSAGNQNITQSTEISEIDQLHYLIMKKNNQAQRGGNLVSSHNRWGVLALVYLSYSRSEENEFSCTWKRKTINSSWTLYVPGTVIGSKPTWFHLTLKQT